MRVVYIAVAVVYAVMLACNILALALRRNTKPWIKTLGAITSGLACIVTIVLAAMMV